MEKDHLPYSRREVEILSKRIRKKDDLQCLDDRPNYIMGRDMERDRDD